MNSLALSAAIVLSLCLSPGLCLSQVYAGGGYEFRVHDAEGFVGETVSVPVDLTINDDAIESWQLAVCHDADVVALVSVASGQLADGSFESISEDDGFWSAAVVVDVVGDDTLAQGGEAYSAEYELRDDKTTTLELCDTGLDEYGVSVVVDGESVSTTRVDGAITSNSPFRFVLNELEATWYPESETGTARLRFAIENDAMTGASSFSVAITHDPDYLAPASGVALDPIEALNDGDGPDFFSVNTEPIDDDGLTVGCLFNFFNFGVTLDFEDGENLVELVYDVVAGPELGEKPVESSLSFGSVGAVKNAATFSLKSVAAVVVEPAGTFTIEAADGAGFRRGDCDGDGQVFAVLDAYYLLEYGYTFGPEPPCLAGADCDGNGVIFPIIDAVYLLEYGFVQGPPPPDPGPTDCGPDTADPGPGCESDCP